MEETKPENETAGFRCRFCERTGLPEREMQSYRRSNNLGVCGPCARETGYKVVETSYSSTKGPQ